MNDETQRDAASYVRRADTIDSKPINRIAGEMTAPDPVFEKEGKFYFYDETWTNAFGPFETREEGQAALRKYAESLG
jgi:hypothetical protein